MTKQSSNYRSFRKIVQLSVLLILAVITTESVAQSALDRYNKYWNYRQNLDYFIAKGLGPGKSTIAEIRNKWGGSASDQLEFGDAGINQGWYIGVLATEYAVLISEGETNKAKQTLVDLLFALEAVNRLDYVADNKFFNLSSPPPTPPVYPNPNAGATLNGFAVRTDAWNDYPSGGFVGTNYNALNQTPYPLDAWGNPWGPVTKTGRDYSTPTNDHTFWSQDQLYHILMGLYLTDFYVGGGTHTVEWFDPLFGVMSATVDFEVIAEEIAFRFVHKLADDDFRLRDLYGNAFSNAAGGDARSFAKGIMSTVLQMGSSYPYTQNWSQLWHLNVLGANSSADVAHMLLIVAALSNENINISGTALSSIYGLASNSNYEWQAFYPLLHNNLHGPIGLPTSFLCIIEQELNSAPVTNPEHSTSLGGPLGWSSHSKFTKDKNHQDNGDPSGNFDGHFSGVDYMLLYNLWRLRRPSPPNNCLETGIMNGFKYCDNITVFGTSIVLGSLTMVASNSIHIYPNFIAAGGNTFHGRIEECGLDKNGFAPAAPQESNNTIQLGEVEEPELSNTQFGIKIYPNPNNGQFNITIENTAKDASIQVFNLVGQVIWSANNTKGKTTIDIGKQPKGMYLVRITIGDEVYNEKVTYQ
jgi:hypothetical protein